MRSEWLLLALLTATLCPAAAVASDRDENATLEPAPPKPEGAKANIETYEGAGEESAASKPSWYSRSDDERYAFDPPVKEHGDYRHDGLFVRFALGPAYLTGRWEGDAVVNGAMMGYASDWEAVGMHAEAALGGSPFDGFTLAIRLGLLLLPDPQFESDLAGRTLDISPVMSPLIGGMLDWYLMPDNGLHLSWTAALSFLDMDDDEGALGSSTMVGGVVGGGIGYDAWMSEQWSVGAQLRVDVGFFDAESADDQVDFVAPSAQLTFTYH